MSDDAPDLRKLAARSLNRSCKQFLGNESQCDLMTMKFERGEISFDDYIKEMETVFQHHAPVEPSSNTVAEATKSAVKTLKNLLEKE